MWESTPLTTCHTPNLYAILVLTKSLVLASRTAFLLTSVACANTGLVEISEQNGIPANLQKMVLMLVFPYRAARYVFLDFWGMTSC
jgi:hypothetical protein